MKDTGIIRKLDELGRVVIPKEIRDNLNFNEDDQIEIYVKGKEVILKKHYTRVCQECGNTVIEENAIYCDICGKKLEVER